MPSLPARIHEGGMELFHQSYGFTNQRPHCTGFGTTFGYLWWYGYHLPRVRERDAFYTRLEQERAAQRG
ncbi:uncharacterized protein N7477_007182 [Penicillium maclennaniae]|uniref:uncharacterized protein n=1 Tax=Penicillium maclennaniae TaxID=1343394 RepID=UPI002540D718|nr:uncharacterized protein N7477_007182 [Penicillium maclennaniae]KAJ5668612.1 hypothetical protein N7477_007182 [Penicillium maclennaniae]